MAGHGGRDTVSRNVLVTGASTGIGRATARLFAEQGFRVFGTSRRPRADVGGVEMLELDVRSEDSVLSCLATVLDRAGRIDVLVNNAGVMHLGVAEETSMDDARAVFETNLFGVARLVNAVLPGMRGRRHGRIINIGSAAAWIGEPGEACYAASKGALARYTEAVRHEVRPFGIHVSLVESGAFRTNVVGAASIGADAIPDYDAVRQAARRTLQDNLRAGGDPAEVARLILKIARARSPRMRYGVGREAHWIPLLKVLLPQRLVDLAIRRAFGLRETA